MRRLKVLHLDLMELEELLKNGEPVRLINPLPEDAKIVGVASVVNMFAIKLSIESEEFPEEYTYHVISDLERLEFEKVELEAEECTNNTE